MLQYAVAVTLNYEEIKKDSQRITQFKPFIKKYNWDKVNFSSEKDDWEISEKNNVTISLKVLYAKKDLIMFQNITQIVKKSYFFNDSSGKGWHYLVVKKLSALLRRITSKRHGDIYCLNCLYSLATEKRNLDCIKKYVKIKIFGM